MDGRKKLSGAAYKRLAKGKAEREEEVLAKVPKLDQFFKPKPKSCAKSAIEPELVPSSSGAHEHESVQVPVQVEVEGR